MKAARYPVSFYPSMGTLLQTRSAATGTKTSK
jgi:hypothetical protein